MLVMSMLTFPSCPFQKDSGPIHVVSLLDGLFHRAVTVLRDKVGMLFSELHAA